MNTQKFMVRSMFYIIGILTLTLGIALTIVVNLGASPIDALLVGLYKNYGLSVGTWEYIVATCLLLINSVVNKKMPQLLALITAVLVGLGIDLWLYVISMIELSDALWISLAGLLIGTIFTGVGIATYLQADFLPSPFDQAMLTISRIFNLSIFYSKTLLMLFFMILALFFKGPVAYGTVLILLTSGPLIGWFYPRMQAFKIKKMEVA